MQARELEVFGAVDGLVACMGIVLAMAATPHTPAHDVWHAALGLFVAEGLGMAVSELLGENQTGWRSAALMGGATGLPILAIGAPWIVLGSSGALVASIVVALLLAGVVAALRGGGRSSWLKTYGILIGVSAVSALSGAV
jgi:hypothetical protein